MAARGDGGFLCHAGEFCVCSWKFGTVGSVPIGLRAGLLTVHVGTVDYRLKDTNPEDNKRVWNLDHYHTSIAVAELRKSFPYAGNVSVTSISRCDTAPTTTRRWRP